MKSPLSEDIFQKVNWICQFVIIIIQNFKFSSAKPISEFFKNGFLYISFLLPNIFKYKVFQLAYRQC